MFLSGCQASFWGICFRLREYWFDMSVILKIKYLKTVISVLAGMVLFASFFIVGKNEGENTMSDKNMFAKIEFIDYEKNKKSLNDFEDKILVINSWAVWCPFCRNELPDFALLQAEFLEDITVIAIDRTEPFEKVKTYTDTLEIS